MTLLIERRRAEGVEEHLPRTISNSEVSAFTQCERKHYYGFLQKLEPKSVSQPLARGIIGHEAMEAAYHVIMEAQQEYEGHAIDTPNGVSDRATQAGVNVILRYMQDTDADKAMLADLITLVTRYFRYYDVNEWMILAIEKAYEIPVNDEWYFGMRLDLLVREKDGTIALVDHKFVYDFYSDSVLEMNPQMPKYLGTLRFNGIQASKAILNQIRYRMKKGGNTDEELFKRAVLKPNNAEVRQYMAEQFRISERIMARRDMAPEAQSIEAVRTANQMVCKNCSFQPLCKSEAMGGNIEIMKSLDYKPNSYDERNNPAVAELE